MFGKTASNWTINQTWEGRNKRSCSANGNLIGKGVATAKLIGMIYLCHGMNKLETQRTIDSADNAEAIS